MSINFDAYQARVAGGRDLRLDACLTNLQQATEILQTAYLRDYLDPALGDFRPDLEDWMAQQLGEILRAAANVSTAMGSPFGDIAMRSVTYEP